MLRIHGTRANFTVLRFSFQTGGPHINISSTLPSNNLSIGVAINLTCTAWQTNELAKDNKTRPHIIEWFDPQGKRIGLQCQAGLQSARLMKCPLEVGALTDENLGNYTCRARNSLDYLSTKRFQVDRQQGKSKNLDVKMPARRVEKVSEYFIAIDRKLKCSSGNQSNELNWIFTSKKSTRNEEQLGENVDVIFT